MGAKYVWLLVLAALPALAQLSTATLVGQVVDATAAGVPAASVAVRQADTNELRQAQSDANGEFTIPNLGPGIYAVTVKKQGFRTLEERGLELQVGQVARLNLRLEVGALAESIEVTAQAPVLNTDSAVRGDVVANKEILEMPLDGRAVTDLAYMVPEVSDATDTGTSGSKMAINGARSDNTNLVIDGISGNDVRSGGFSVSIPLDAVQEFKMQTSGFSAEFGRQAGGVISMALKTGGNRLHGSAFEFLRNDKLDARNFFAAGKDKLRRNQYGASLDGPVFVPRLYDGRDRTFFLFSWESQKQITGSSRLTRVPSALERGGDFSATVDTAGKAVAIKDPFGTGTFPGARIPLSRFHAAASKVLPYFPAPNRPGQINNLLSYSNLENNWDNLAIKADHRFSPKDTFSVRILKRLGGSSNPFGGNDLGLFATRYDTSDGMIGLIYTRTISPTLINEARLGATRTLNNGTTDDTGHNYPAELGIPGLITEPKFVGFPRFEVRDMAFIGPNASQPFITTGNNFNYADTATWVKGVHMLKFGGDVIRMQVFQPFVTNLHGRFQFLGRWTNVPLADLQLGMPDSAIRLIAPAWNYMFGTSYGAFVQDDVKLTRRLTLNLGLRYELNRPPVDKYDRWSSFVPEAGKIVVADDRGVTDLAAQAAEAGLTGKVGLARDYGLPRALTHAPRRNLAPRFGFAWRPLGTRTVVRGGYGIFYAGSSLNATRKDLGNGFPFVVSQTFRRQANDPTALTLSNPFPVGKAAPAGTTNTTGYELYPAAQYLQSWNLTLERSLGASSAVEVSYSASKGTHIGKKYDINQPFRNPDLRQSGGFPRPYPGFGTIGLYTFGTNSSYQAGILSVRKRLARGFFYRASYVLSKSLDYQSELTGSSTGGYTGAQDARNLRLERGRSDWDSRHVFSMNFSYEVPRTMGRALGGWQLAGTGKARGGQPFTVRMSNVQLDAGEANRPDRIGFGTVANPTPDRWFDLAAFVPVPLGAYRFGNSGRNILDGPGQVAVNLSLSKRFHVAERHSVQFRMEAFNVTNHANFVVPETAIDAADAGTITRAGAARVMQVGVRYQF